MSKLWGPLLLALLISGNNEKKEIASLIDKAYHYRSSYLHHGEKGSVNDILRELQIKIWTALEKSVQLATKFKTKLEFIDGIDECA